MAADADEVDGRRPSPARRLARWLAGAVVVGLVAWGVAGGVALLMARSEAEEGRAVANDARERLGAEAISEGLLVADLRRSARSFERAHDLARSPVTGLWRVLPVAGRQVRSFAALSATASTVGDVSADSLERLADLVDDPGSGAARVALVEGVEGLTVDALRRLRQLDLGPDEALIPPLARARQELRGELVELEEALGLAADVAGGLEALLSGSDRYLLLLGNNAEMRLGSGMFLSAGILHIDDGTLALGDIEPTNDLYLPEEAAVELDPELETLWGWSDARREWRDLGLSPRFPVTADQAGRMWQARTGEQVDGVMAIDVVALRGILAATGPVEVAGTSYSSERVVDQLLFEQYVGLDGREESQTARREVLGAIAAEAVAALEAGDWDAGVLADELAAAAGGRHIMIWSRADREQRAWERAGLSGEVDAGSLMVGLINRGGNKLDQFMHVDVRQEVEDAGDGMVELSLTVEVRNEAPAEGPQYVLGPHPGGHLQTGEYGGALAVVLPGSSGDLAVHGAELSSAGPDGPVYVAVVPLRLPRGDEQTVTFQAIVPAGVEMSWLPAARVPEVTVSGDLTGAD